MSKIKSMNSYKMTLPLVFHTVRHLRSEQIVGQMRMRLWPFKDSAKAVRLHAQESFPGCQWQPKTHFIAPGSQENTQQRLLTGVMCFLNHTKNVHWPPDWHQRDETKLWQYNMHYFEWLWALDYQHAKNVTLDWIDKYSFDKANTGWEPYPTSLRLMNWAAIFWAKYRRQTEYDREFSRQLFQSIHLQGQWLQRRIETHILGNHLLENCAALVFIGTCFKGNAAENWLNQGREILVNQIDEQILDDGMHFERSPMYHLRVMYVLATLLNVASGQLAEVIGATLKKMATALTKLCHTDGQIALLNDSAFGVANSAKQILHYVDRVAKTNYAQLTPPQGHFVLPDCGYYGQRRSDGSYLIVDAGQLGPDYLLGHGHADIFSFELSLKGSRVIVDSGVYDYLDSTMRKYCRSTASHNTVTVNEADQCELWKVFRVARRGYPRDVHFATDDSKIALSAWHDGYRRLKGSPIHHRSLQYDQDGQLIVSDLVKASKRVAATSRIHLHPLCSIAHIEKKAATIKYDRGIFRVVFEGKGALAIEESFYCPQFGKAIPNKCLAFSAFGEKIEIQFTLTSQ